MSRSVPTLAVALGFAIGCSSSTAPADPFVGQWRVAVASALAGDSLVPDTFVVGVAKAGGGYHLTFPALEVFITTYHFAIADTAASSGFTGHGDSASFTLGGAGLPCDLNLGGVVNGGSATGSVILEATACTLGTATVGTWTAVKQ